MKRKSDQETLMSRYLLGELPEEEQLRMEERFFTDEEHEAATRQKILRQASEEHRNQKSFQQMASEFVRRTRMQVDGTFSKRANARRRFTSLRMPRFRVDTRNFHMTTNDYIPMCVLNTDEIGSSRLQ